MENRVNYVKCNKHLGSYEHRAVLSVVLGVEKGKTVSASWACNRSIHGAIKIDWIRWLKVRIGNTNRNWRNSFSILFALLLPHPFMLVDDFVRSQINADGKKKRKKKRWKISFTLDSMKSITNHLNLIHWRLQNQANHFYILTRDSRTSTTAYIKLMKSGSSNFLYAIIYIPFFWLLFSLDSPMILAMKQMDFVSLW